MRSSTFAALALAFAIAVSAAPSQSNSQCSTSSLRCCNSVESARSDRVSSILDALKLNLDAADNVGLACDPINPVTVGGGISCNAMPVCCNGNHYGGFSVGCSPIPIIL
ncbi:uncharacterized protein BXZ73DRAFT_75868 [Epithele typhae]|uniref:uncharacterized protein n=1 Tax=Epithele typhae TaxID=378194 RepID=UPI002007B1BC|nr:uncharacterized protein BXZ73DRAFT_75868 [Epithele typhae]KAH9939673.1 hypothetical protein BXZ73DRAFT_75868 [Epithele typhae]